MSRIARLGRRVHRSLARRASPPGAGEPQARQPRGRGPFLAIRPDRYGMAAWFARDMAAAASLAAGQHAPPPTSTNIRRHGVTPRRLAPRTIQLCIHCQQYPAGFWVSRNGGQAVRRPWCLSCCRDLDSDCYRIRPFDS